MTFPETPRHVEIRNGGQVVVAADAVMDLPEVQASHRLEATVPLGDGEFLGRLRERTTGAVTRPAGSTVLLDATIPPQRLPSP
jgi:hypothetical protein